MVTFPWRLQVTCVGHVIGAVVADTQIHAQRAAKAVRIQYEELRPIVTIQVSHLDPEVSMLARERFPGSHMTKLVLKNPETLTVGLIDRRPLPPSPSMTQSEPCKMETWRWGLNRPTTSSKVCPRRWVSPSRFQQTDRVWAVVHR